MNYLSDSDAHSFENLLCHRNTRMGWLCGLLVKGAGSHIGDRAVVIPVLVIEIHTRYVPPIPTGWRKETRLQHLEGAFSPPSLSFLSLSLTNKHLLAMKNKRHKNNYLSYPNVTALTRQDEGKKPLVPNQE